jgi:hypothetical protein
MAVTTSGVEEEVLLPTRSMYAEIDEAGVKHMLDEHLAIRREALRLADRESGHPVHDDARAGVGRPPETERVRLMARVLRPTQRRLLRRKS